jgi:hypothetical protein
MRRNDAAGAKWRPEPLNPAPRMFETGEQFTNIHAADRRVRVHVWKKAPHESAAKKRSGTRITRSGWRINSML